MRLSSLSPGLRGACFSFLLLALAGPAFAQSPPLHNPPAIDGDLDDMIRFAQEVADSGFGCGLLIVDPEGDVRTDDVSVVPCSPFPPGSDTFRNGFDQILSVVALNRGDLYLGMRLAGAVGDPDGDGSPSGSCAASTILDEPGIGSADSYRFEFDTECRPGFSPGITIEITGDPDNPGTIDLKTQGITVDAFTVAVGGEGGRDLEIVLLQVVVDDWDMLLEPRFSARTVAGNADDTLEEDLSGVEQCPEPRVTVTLKTYFEEETVCPGDTVTVFVSVFNWSSVTLEEVVLEDRMPEGWTYVPGSAVRIGEPAVENGLLRFPEFPLWPVEGLWIRFRAVVGPDCDGVQINRVESTAHLITGCVEGGSKSFGPLVAEADILCRAPGVEIGVAGVEVCGVGPVDVPVRVENTSAHTEDVLLECFLDGTALTPVTVTGLASGESFDETYTVTCEFPGTSTFLCRATVSLTEDPACRVERTAAAAIGCRAPCLEVSRVADEVCAGRDASVRFLVTSCSGSEQDVRLTGTLNGQPLDAIGVPALAAGADHEFEVPVSCGEDDTLDFVWSARASIETLETCEIEQSFAFRVPCAVPAVSVYRSHEPESGNSARVQVVVANTGSARLEPVLVTDLLAASLDFSGRGPIGPCGLGIEAVEPAGDGSLIRFVPLSLAAGEACTLEYRLDCVGDGLGGMATAQVTAWCAGTRDTGDPVTDSDTDFITCRIPSCPHPENICFWRTQFGDDDSGSSGGNGQSGSGAPGGKSGSSGSSGSGGSKEGSGSSGKSGVYGGSGRMCEEAMAGLARCVIQNSGVDRWQRRGGYDKAAELAALDDEGLLVALDAQLSTSNYLSLRDYAEGQYLVLLLNLCAGLLPAETRVEDGFSGTVSGLILGMEEAINLDSKVAPNPDLDSWRIVVCRVNNGFDLLIPEGCREWECDDDDEDDDSGSSGWEGDGSSESSGSSGSGSEESGCCEPLAYGKDNNECCAAAGHCDPLEVARRLGYCLDGASGPDLIESGVTYIVAFPNPAVGAGTAIRYRVEEHQSGETVAVEIFDVTGRLVRRLLEEPRPAGTHELSWDLSNETGGRVPNGFYFTCLRIGKEIRSNRVLVLPR